MAIDDKIICIVEDNDELREALALMIQYSDGFALGGSFCDAESAMDNIPFIMPDAVLMDINLPVNDGIVCVGNLKNRYPQILFLMCTSFEDNDKIFNSLKAGASGYILKTEGPENIINALSEMIEGGSPMSSAIARKVVASFNQSREAQSFSSLLTEREKDVLQFLSKGLMNKEVAAAMEISTGTVRKHIQHIYEKLHVSTRVEAVNMFLNR
ncbi:MAG TPA: response regulator transcription factor [Ferruginibacter sp.]|nr:response regulator transcription factor [Ferruginibacter sp.]